MSIVNGKGFEMKKSFLILPFLLLLFAAEAFADPILFSFDALSRVRYEYLGNNYFLGYSGPGNGFVPGNDRQSYFRFKFSAGMTASYEDFVFGYIKLTNESRSYIYNDDGSSEYNINEFLIENLYIDLPKLLDSTDIKIGRMDLPASEYGEGFLIADGTPIDGDRTSYFNAAKIKYTMESGASVEFLGIYNSRVDDMLPVFNANSPATQLNDSNEEGLVVYGRTDPSKDFYFEPYYMYKHEDPQPEGRLEDEIHTFGSYFKYNPDKSGFVLRGQGAVQISNYNNGVYGAFGGYVFADLPIAGIVDPFTIGYVYLSGTNATSGNGDSRGWDPLFSRYAWMSEIVSSLYTNESGYNCWTNLQMVKADVNLSPLPKTKIVLSNAFLFANDAVFDNPMTNSPQMFGNGRYRGNLSIAKISYEFSKNFSAAAHGEYFKPGDFYMSGAKDAVFFRLEFLAKL